jgi:transcriptional regulator with XRE-family HTH domain
MADRDNHRELAQRFGRNVLRARRRAGLSQEELRIRAALHRIEIGLLERGIRLPRLDTIIKVAGGIEIDPGDLLKGIAWVSNDRHPAGGEFTTRVVD